MDSGAAAVEETKVTSAEKKAKKAVEAMKVAKAAMEAAGLSPGTIRNTYAAQFQVSRTCVMLYASFTSCTGYVAWVF